jgi:hypothetical protein
MTLLRLIHGTFHLLRVTETYLSIPVSSKAANCAHLSNVAIGSTSGRLRTEPHLAPSAYDPHPRGFTRMVAAFRSKFVSAGA